MSYTVITEAKEPLYRPNPSDHPESGYLFYQDEAGFWTWLWQEPGEEDEFGAHFSSKADAIEDIALNWLETGGNDTPRFVGMLRGLATKARAEESTQ